MYPRRRSLGCFRVASFATLIFLFLSLALPGLGQEVVGTIPSPADTVWYDLEVYDSGNVIFIADSTNAQILVYNATTLGYVDTISLAAYLPDTPQSTVLHQGTGTLYVSVGRLSATAQTTLVIIDADTRAIIDDIENVGTMAALGIDEARARLYALGGDYWLEETLTAIDVNSNTVVGSLNIDDLMGGGSLDFSTDTWLNPVTGELVIANLNYDKFVVVNGPAMTGEVIAAADSRGGPGAWNPVENKIYITTVDWNGYFIYDRDTGTSTTTTCINDGTLIFYSQATNRIYSGAEIDGRTTVIEGATDACQNVDLAPALPKVGFMNATRHAYFTGAYQVKVLDEDSLTVVDTIPGCEPEAYGAVDSQVVVSQALGRVFVRGYWSNPTEGNCILVIEDKLPDTCKVDFDGDGQEDILWRYYGPGGFNYVWYLGDSGAELGPAAMLSQRPAGGSVAGPSSKTTAGRTPAAGRDRKNGKAARDGMSLWSDRSGRSTVVQDPRSAARNPLRALRTSLTDPRQIVSLTADRPLSAPVMLGGAEILPVEDLSWEIAGAADFDGDTHVDILWRHNGPGGENVIWLMDGTSGVGNAALPPVADLNWQISGTGDFNNDAHVDILWRYNGGAGTNLIWYMNGTEVVGSAELVGVSDLNWQVAGTGDFNKDGHIDVLWRYYGQAGFNVIWHLQDGQVIGAAETMAVSDLNWQVGAIGDFNKDGNVDILWRYYGSTGFNYIWYMDQADPVGGGEIIPVSDLQWRIVNR